MFANWDSTIIERIFANFWRYTSSTRLLLCKIFTRNNKTLDNVLTNHWWNSLRIWIDILFIWMIVWNLTMRKSCIDWRRRSMTRYAIKLTTLSSSFWFIWNLNKDYSKYKFLTRKAMNREIKTTNASAKRMISLLIKILKTTIENVIATTTTKIKTIKIVIKIMIETTIAIKAISTTIVIVIVIVTKNVIIVIEKIVKTFLTHQLLTSMTSLILRLKKFMIRAKLTTHALIATTKIIEQKIAQNFQKIKRLDNFRSNRRHEEIAQWDAYWQRHR